MYNNEITYDEKWNTPANRAALKKLDKKYFRNSRCYPSCPLSWAVEVLELMDELDKVLGFKYNEHSIRGYEIEGHVGNWFFSTPIKSIFKNLKGLKNPPRSQKNKSLWERLKSLPKNTINDILNSFEYGITALRARHINPYLNKYLSNQLAIEQLKEKYGELRLYFSAPKYLDTYVESKIRECEIKLALKGAYYPLENLYNSYTGYYVGNEYRPDVIKVSPTGSGALNVQQTTYREIMKNMEIDLEEVAKKAKPLEFD